MYLTRISLFSVKTNVSIFGVSNTLFLLVVFMSLTWCEPRGGIWNDQMLTSLLLVYITKVRSGYMHFSS